MGLKVFNFCTALENFPAAGIMDYYLHGYSSTAVLAFTSCAHPDPDTVNFTVKNVTAMDGQAGFGKSPDLQQWSFNITF